MNATDLLLAFGRRSAEAGVLVLLVLAAQALFRRQLSAQWRCALWLLVVARLLPVSFSGPASVFNLWPGWAAPPAPLRAATPAPAIAVARPARVDENGATPIDPPAAITAGETHSPASTPAPAAPRVSLPGVLLGLWLAGVVALGARVAFTTWAFARQLRRFRAVADPDALALLRECAARLGVRRVPRLIEGAAIATPALHGLVRPQLLLPAGFTTRFSREELRFVFLHELAHVRRRDLLLNWIITALQIAHWFNPLVWLGFARWRADREIAADAMALDTLGSQHRRAYGCTMLRLVTAEPAPRPHAALVGILESKRDLARRLRQVAAHAAAPRPFFAIALFAVLAFVGLTDARTATAGQAAPAANATAAGAIAPAAARLAPESTAFPPAPSPLALADLRLDGKSVLFLVSTAETMLGENAAEVARHKPAPAAAPKWRQVSDTLVSLVQALPPDTHYAVAGFQDNTVTALGSWVGRNPPEAALADLRAVLGRATPKGASDLGLAFQIVTRFPTDRPFDRIVLITDRLPDSRAGNAADTEAQRTEFFQSAVKQLPPRVPVSTVLLPYFPGDRATAGHYWELANATRGAFVALDRAAGGPAPTHLAFVIDTSGSMRSPNTGGLWPVVARKITEVLDAHRDLAGVQFLDADGRVLLPAADGRRSWHTPTPEFRPSLARALETYGQDTISNPIPGVHNVLRFYRESAGPDARLGIYILGDEFTAEAAPTLARLDELNPRRVDGTRAATIHAIGFPTTIRYQFSMGNTGVKFAELMRGLAHEHGGAFIALPDL